MRSSDWRREIVTQVALDVGYDSTSAFIAMFRRALGTSGGEIDWILDGPWAKLALLITVAIAVLTMSNLLMKRRNAAGGGRIRGDFDLEVAKMEQLPITPIAQAKAGPVRLEAVLVSTQGSLGGKPGRECVWRNRYGGARSTAVASELVMARDSSGQVGIEDLEGARVLAPKDEGGGKHEFASLYLGDRVELLGYLRAEHHGDAEAASERVYGMMGVDSQVQVRMLERATPSETEAEEPGAPDLEQEAKQDPEHDPKPQPDATTSSGDHP